MSNYSEEIAPGTIIHYAGPWFFYFDVPPGWLLCDGGTLAQSDYKALYSAIGSRYNTGGEPAGSFRLPGFTNGACLKYTTTYSGNEYGGFFSAHTHNLTGIPGTNSMDAENGHSHGNSGSTTSTGNNHNHGVNLTANANSAGNGGRSVGNANGHVSNHSHGVSGSWGVAGPHNHNVSANANSNFGHSHNSPSTNVTIGLGSGSISQPTISMWNLIKA